MTPDFPKNPTKNLLVDVSFKLFARNAFGLACSVALTIYYSLWFLISDIIMLGLLVSSASIIWRALTKEQAGFRTYNATWDLTFVTQVLFVIIVTVLLIWSRYA